jgi:hypothetical protein
MRLLAAVVLSHLTSLIHSQIHHYDPEPTPNMISLFVSYMVKQTGPSGKLISIRTITSYLSGLAHHLEPFYPSVRDARKHPMVVNTLCGAEQTDGQPIVQKSPIEDAHLLLLLKKFGASQDFDDCLFLAIAFTALHGLLWLGELVVPDDPSKLVFRKLVLRQSVDIFVHDSLRCFQFLLPTHKADRRFHGSHILIQSRSGPLDPVLIFESYLRLQDDAFSFFPQLWVQGDGSLPSHSWFLQRLRSCLPKEFAGHSFCSGGATHLAALGFSDSRIQALGRWSSDAWCIYIRKNPVILCARSPISSWIFDS